MGFYTLRRERDPEQLDALTRLNIEDLIASFKLDHIRRGRRLLELLCWLPARRFAHQILAYEQMVGSGGLHLGASWIVHTFARRLEIYGAECVPHRGPLLVLSNHPGMSDAMALFVALSRPDLKVIAAERKLLHLLPNISRHLVFIPEGESESRGRMSGMRTIAAHLRRGGAALIYPAGRIEPDPLVMPDAIDALVNWSESVSLFARLAPEALVLPVAIGGTISAAALRNPIPRLYRKRRDREWAAATLQVLIPAYRPPVVRVVFTEPFQAASLAELGDPPDIMRAITGRVADAMRRMQAPQHADRYGYPVAIAIGNE
ncbi:lysophospholipid acyltransferase family protein [Roseiflexus castenholzii]|uniref:lysophospholipid acyltransferase family protein n=1 Tax=Roseiflexus castenholzii TaxID=120962 RepID=UPI003C7C0A72